MPDIFVQPTDKEDTPDEKKEQVGPVQSENQPVLPPVKTTQPTLTSIETPPQNNSNNPKQKTSDHEAEANKILSEKEHHTIGLFSHYCPNPTGVRFINQETNEIILLFLRKHFITNISWIVGTFFMLLLPILFFTLFQIANFSLFTIPLSILIILTLFYYLIIFNYALMNFIVWFYHVGIVTKKRMLDIDVDNILHHHISETNISDVVDVSYAQSGFFQSFFDYGDVPIQTEAIKANFEFESSPKPATVSDLITDLRPHVQHSPQGEQKHA